MTRNKANGKLEGEPLVQLLHRACQEADQMFSKEVGDLDLTPRQFAVLEALGRHTSTSQVTLTAETHIDRSTMADIVKRLVEKGLVQRKRAKNDARAYAVSLTDKGKSDLRRGLAAAKRMDGLISRVITHKQEDGLRSGLQKLVAAVRNETE